MEGVFTTSQEFPLKNHLKFEDRNSQKAEKGHTLQIMQCAHQLLTLRLLEDNTFALFAISPKNGLRNRDFLQKPLRTYVTKFRIK